jgi:3-isopropylmalate/(R)-2-methylmalate dehydratase small subunit
VDENTRRKEVTILPQVITGYGLRIGNNIDTDQIYPGRYLDLTDPREIGKHALEGCGPSLLKGLKHPGILVAGRNFGCGSSREHAVITLIQAGFKAVAAASFGRIFFRNAINLGLPAVICPDLLQQAEDGDYLEIDLVQGLIRIPERSTKIPIAKMPPYVMSILDKGGLVPLLRSMAQGD